MSEPMLETGISLWTVHRYDADSKDNRYPQVGGMHDGIDEALIAANNLVGPDERWNTFIKRVGDGTLRLVRYTPVPIAS